MFNSQNTFPHKFFSSDKIHRKCQNEEKTVTHVSVHVQSNWPKRAKIQLLDKNSKQLSNNNNVGKYEEICLNLSDYGFVQNVTKKGPMISAWHGKSKWNWLIVEDFLWLGWRLIYIIMWSRNEFAKNEVDISVTTKKRKGTLFRKLFLEL